MKAKPIFLANLPIDSVDKERFAATQKALELKLGDYHVLVIVTKTTEPKFECFNCDDIDMIAFDDFKKRVSEKLI